MARLDDEQIEIIKILYEEGRTYTEINYELYRLFGIKLSDDAIRYHCVRKDKPKVSTVEKLSIDGITKKLILSDLHIPFHRNDILDIVIKHKDEIDEIIFNGDIIDCGEISSFDDLGSYSITEEMAITHKLLKDIDNLTPNIPKIVNFGNHEMRWRRYLAKTNTALNNLHSDNILKEICGGFTDHDFKRGIETKYEELKNYTVVDNWWFQINDTIICHPISFSKVKGRTATMAVDYFVQQHIEFNAIIVGHTHSQCSLNHYGKETIEQGCLCLPMKYSTSGKLGYTPQINGYELATFKDKQFNINLSKPYRLY